MISEMNIVVGSYMPHWFWDMAQFSLAILSFVLLFVERRINVRYMTRYRKNAHLVKRFFIWCGQLSVGLAGALAILIFADVVTPPNSPPRTIVVAFLVMICLRQLSTCYAAYERAIENGELPFPVIRIIRRPLPMD